MKYLDFAIQTIIFAFAIVLLFVSYGEADWPLALLYAQLMLGPWQMISCLISIAARAPYYGKKRLHFLLAMLYLVVLYAFTAAIPVEAHTEIISRIMFTVPAWALGTFYYILTWKWVFTRKRNGKFLPNLSF